MGLTDGFGETLYECQYNGYGQIIDETYHEVGNRAIPDNPLRFQGQYYDEETGLHYNLNRYYDPFVGRYITQDPIKLIGGFNFYAYVNGNPINWIDPLGYIRGLNSDSGQYYAKEILEGGTGTAFAGHGYYRFGTGEIIVPEGTMITLPREDISIADITGRLIERGDWEGLIKLAETDSHVRSDLIGMRTWLPGEKIPNYILDVPRRLIIYRNSMVVAQPTELRVLLKPNMGCVQWAACTEYK
ncbi:RHS repeat-associated core domain-containing protein [Gilliamella apicola]|uniref:RHS repeat-associated core domain-containing protein n=1 Tax=Gilliamella apicola TaxID=1196095 RepID=UPI0035C91AA1